jgi:tRNA-splicing ligase RtcB (3'-phosphate/5'-hydroxy nucleic acid ligase)
LDRSRLHRVSDTEWRVEPRGKMRVPSILFATEKLLKGMDDKVFEQVTNVATLPGIEKASFAMPDAHWGYGFPIGGVAAFDAERGGVISAGGVGFDISCGVRTLLTELAPDDVARSRDELADALFRSVPAGVGSTSSIRLGAKEMDAMLRGGARWAVKEGYGTPADLERIEAGGAMAGADPGSVSERAKTRQRDEMGTLGSGNHYLEVQRVVEVYDATIARTFGLDVDSIVVSIHCGSRGLGHQIGTDYLKLMVNAAGRYGIALPDRELACVPLKSDEGRKYLGAMRAGINCALANRQIVTQFVRRAFAEVFGEKRRPLPLPLLYDVSHNTCKEETHWLDGEQKRLFVHRKGATRAFGPGRPELPDAFRDAGQPVLIGGSMGTSSYVLAGTEKSMRIAFGSACHGAGRSMSRHQAFRTWQGQNVIDDLAGRGILIRSRSYRGVAEEAPGAYKDVEEVVDAADEADLARKVAKVVPLICVKG